LSGPFLIQSQGRPFYPGEVGKKKQAKQLYGHVSASFSRFWLLKNA